MNKASPWPDRGGLPARKGRGGGLETQAVKRLARSNAEPERINRKEEDMQFPDRIWFQI